MSAPAFPRSVRFIQILGTLSARMDAEERKLLDELMMATRRISSAACSLT